MSGGEPEPVQMIEQALARIRRSQQSRRLQRGASGDDPSAASAASAARFRYLDALDEADGLAISQIAEAIDVDRPRASRLTAELSADGLIEREASPDDSRYARIRLTPEGKDFVDRVRQRRRQHVTAALAGFTAEESRTFAELLERFVHAWPRQ